MTTTTTATISCCKLKSVCVWLPVFLSLHPLDWTCAVCTGGWCWCAACDVIKSEMRRAYAAVRQAECISRCGSLRKTTAKRTLAHTHVRALNLFGRNTVSALSHSTNERSSEGRLWCAFLFYLFFFLYSFSSTSFGWSQSFVLYLIRFFFSLPFRRFFFASNVPRRSSSLPLWFFLWFAQAPSTKRIVRAWVKIVFDVVISFVSCCIRRCLTISQKRPILITKWPATVLRISYSQGAKTHIILAICYFWLLLLLSGRILVWTNPISLAIPSIYDILGYVDTSPRHHNRLIVRGRGICSFASHSANTEHKR